MRVLAAFLVNTLVNFIIGLLVAKFLGPEEFGRFALALAIGAMIQTVSFEWIRLAAIRFYSEKTRSERPELRATLDASFAVLSFVLAVAAVLLVLGGLTFSLTNTLVALAFAAAITNGLFDYHTALVRARFQDVLYGKLVLTKNIFALTLTVGGAYYFESATMTLAGACISMASSIIYARRALSDAQARPSLASRALAMEHARYSVPIVTANVLYLAIPLTNRALVTGIYGFAETGQFSLSFDIGTRLIAAVGSALDVLLFQIAVRAHETHGAERGRAQVADNMAIVFAILLPSAVGLWLILPSIEQLIVPAQYRGPFGNYLTLMLPGLFCFGMMNFAINPVFQIAKRTMPLIAAAAAACIADPVLFFVLPRSADASSLAIAQAGSFVIAMCVLLGFAAAAGAHWPRMRDIAGTLAATAVMFAVLYPMRGREPGVATLVLQIGAGGVVFLALGAALDLVRLRTAALAFMRRRGLTA